MDHDDVDCAGGAGDEGGVGDADGDRVVEAVRVKVMVVTGMVAAPMAPPMANVGLVHGGRRLMAQHWCRWICWQDLFRWW